MTRATTYPAAPRVQQSLASIGEGQVWTEQGNGLVHVYLRSMHLVTVDGDGVAVGLEISEGPVGRMGHEKRGKPAENLDFWQVS